MIISVLPHVNGLNRFNATGPNMIPIIVATAKHPSAEFWSESTCFADVELFFDEQAQKGEHTNIAP